jgi:acetylornithine deacetylase/succinyl-diaminopimelate desuccinylase-like protein
MKKIVALFLLAFFSVLTSSRPAYTETETLPTLKLLQDLIRINTTNPPGNETQAANYVKAYLERFGIPSEIIESAPGRGNLIARLKGSGQQDAVLLLAHLDVVTADPGEWTRPPFEAVLEGDYLYGRGAVDMKGMAALMINTFIRLKLQRVPLEGDVLLVLVADEESGGKYGTEFLVNKHWDKIKAGLVFNEGSIALKKYGFHFYPVQVAEKGVAWLKLTAQGTSGHGSMPIPDNATVTLINALHRLTSDKQPIQKTAIVSELLDRLSAHFSFPKSFVLKHFFTFPIRQIVSLFGEDKLEADKIFNAMVRNTVVPTVLQAGIKTNVIPAVATAQVDCRILPGETPEGFREKLIQIIDDPKVTVDLITQSMPSQSDFRTKYFDSLEKAIRAHDPEAIVVPFISPGATDNRFFREKGVLAYGIIPFLITMEDLKGLHGKDERIPVSEIERGERILFDFLINVQAQ